MKPALWTRDHNPRSCREIPRPHADEIRAEPTTSQYDIASATVAQNMIRALPYGECCLGLNGVVNISTHRSSFPKGSTARSWVMSVVSSRSRPQGIVDEKANDPCTTGQNVLSVEVIAGSGLGGRIFSHKYELLVHAFRVSTEVVVNSVAKQEG
jgi:hypothetical protein